MWFCDPPNRKMSGLNVFWLGRLLRGAGTSALWLWLAACQATIAATTPPVGVASPSSTFAGSQSCRDCHPKFYSLWATSFHGLAMRPYSRELAVSKLTPQTNDVVAGFRSFRADIAKGVVVEKTPEGTSVFPIVQVTGGKNVYYFLTQLERGWLQVLPVAYDVRRKEWYDTTLSGMRHFADREDEAIYWKERALTFNTSCFNCHVSQLEKNYDLKSDSYRTTWGEPGINCETCHGPSAAHAELFRQWPTNQPPPADLKLIVTSTLSIAQRNDMCAPCHAKMSPLTDSFSPGDRYFDHFDLVTLNDPDFYPDGRDLGENYTWTQWLMSPCAKSGKLDCIHCHTSSGRYRFHEPGRENDACLPCHDERVRNASAHTHHKAGEKGNLCISCHMPMTEFARMRRSDHSMRPPTPATTIAYNSPNACNLCHEDERAEWADEKVRKWRKRDFQKPVLERAALLNAARKHDWKRLPEILGYLNRTDRDEVYTASLARLLVECPDGAKWGTVRRLLKDKSPLVRAVAAESLAADTDPATIGLLAKTASDDYRLVRVRAGAALAGIPKEALPDDDRIAVESALSEYLACLKARPDDMASHYNAGNFHMSRGEMEAASASFETALRLQPDALPPRVNAAVVYSSLGQNEKAEESLRTALRHDPTNAMANLNMGMLMAELGNMDEARIAFETALRSDPQSGQAAYNLGLMMAASNPSEGLRLCQKAAELIPDEPRYAYSVAVLQRQQGKGPSAVLTLEKLLSTSPAHPESYALLAQLYSDDNRIEDAADVCRRAVTNNRLPASVRARFSSFLEQLSQK